MRRHAQREARQGKQLPLAAQIRRRGSYRDVLAQRRPGDCV